MKKDQLSWDEFYKESIRIDLHYLKKINEFNRLVAHTKNFLLYLDMVHLLLDIC